MEHKLQLQQNVEEDKTSENQEGLGATTECSCPCCSQSQNENALWKYYLASRRTRQMTLVLIPVVRLDSETTFLKILKTSVSILHPLPNTSSRQAWWDLSFIALVNCRQLILCSHSPALPTNGDPNTFLCCSRIFPPHPHCLVLHHVRGNYTFIYYVASNIKPWKLYQRQQLFNHPSR